MELTKTCTKCGVTRPLSDFPQAKQGTQTRCTPCKRAYEKAYYYRRTEGQRTNGNQKHYERVQQRVVDVKEYLRTHPCVDCGEDDVVVLDFDHLRDKRMAVSRMVRAGYAWETVLSEIAKCEVRCANCHRRITHARRQDVW